MNSCQLQKAQVFTRKCVHKKYKGCRVTGLEQKKITCHFCFKQFEVDIETHEDFTGHNTEIYDCVVCCNPNKLSYEVNDGEIFSLTVGDGNE